MIYEGHDQPLSILLKGRAMTQSVMACFFFFQRMHWSINSCNAHNFTPLFLFRCLQHGHTVVPWQLQH